MRLITTVDIAAMIGRTRQRVSQLAATPDFPAPAMTMADGRRVWWDTDVLVWIERVGRPVRKGAVE